MARKIPARSPDLTGDITREEIEQALTQMYETGNEGFALMATRSIAGLNAQYQMRETPGVSETVNGDEPLRQLQILLHAAALQAIHTGAHPMGWMHVCRTCWNSACEHMEQTHGELTKAYARNMMGDEPINPEELGGMNQALDDLLHGRKSDDQGK